MKTISFAILACLQTAAFAIPHPYYIRTNEMTAILANRDVMTLIQSSHRLGKGSGRIDAVALRGENKGATVYIVQTGRCALSVQANYVKPPTPHFVGTGELKLAVSKQLTCQSEE